MTAEEYKNKFNEVIIRFSEANKDKFSADESVKIKLELKNIPELVIKVFEFNTETYFRKTKR